VWSRSHENARRFAERESRRHGVAIEVTDTARQAVSGASLVCTTTSAREPVLMGEWIAPGAHINAVGSSVPFTRELDTAAIVKARLFVDRRESVLNEAGDFLFPKKEGAVDNEHIQGEVGEVLLGTVEGRRSREEVTLFKSLGLAIEDLASAYLVYNNAKVKNLGTWTEIGGRHYNSSS
jgi:ornithine cyclodeaminase